jgi:HK97 gp10 family phage protein
MVLVPGYQKLTKGTGAIVLGLDFVQEQLTGFLPREMTAILRRSMAKIAANIRKDMRSGAPRGAVGTLRRAIVSKRDRGSRDSIEASVHITKGREAKNDAFYWHMVEFGTEHSAPKPFIVPAIERAKASYRSDLSSEINRQVIKQLEKRAKKQRLQK